MFRHITGGSGVEVVFHKKTQSTSPFDVARPTACPIVVVVMIDRHVATDAEWQQYITNLGEQAETEGPDARMIPVVMEQSSLVDFPLPQQAILWDEWNGTVEEREMRLLSQLTYEFARMLRNRLHRTQNPSENANEIKRHLEKIKVFISYSKHDSHGADLANDIRCWLHANSALSSFLDVIDIPAGLPFSRVIEHNVKHSALLAIYTDSYSSREWCRREVISAKRYDVPMVVANCLDEGDDRAFPYLGNVPVVRMNPVDRDRVPKVVARLLDDVLRDMLWETRVASLLNHHPHPIFMGRPPEFVSMASRGLESGRQGVVVHPDPPLGDEEKNLLRVAWDGLKLLSMNQWLAEMR